MFSKRLERDIRIGPALSVGRNALIHGLRGVRRILVQSRGRKIGGNLAMLPSAMLGKRWTGAVGMALAAVLLLGLTDLLPGSRRRGSPGRSSRSGAASSSRTVPASEIDKAELRKVLRAKIVEGAPRTGRGLLPDARGARPDRRRARPARRARRLLRRRRSSPSTTRSPAGSSSSAAPRALGADGRGGEGIGRGTHLLARADARPSGRDAAPRRPASRSSRTTATAASRSSACSRARPRSS